MDTFFAILKKSLIATVFVIFTFVGTYVPQTWNQVETVYAGGFDGRSTLYLQVVQNVNLIAQRISAAATAAYTQIISWATGSLFTKEYFLDAIAWAFAKLVISGMVTSLVSWINSGFQGSPSFVQDVSDFLLAAADQAIGGYINQLGAAGSFICSPFRLDVQISVATEYERARSNGGNGQPAPTCNLSEISGNIETFLSGVQGSFTQGGNSGWINWINVTSKPEVYTPYGAVLAAKTGSQIRVLNTKNEEQKVLDFGNGFLSGKVCEGVDGSNQPFCSIVKPGKVIVESLNEHLDSGRESLVVADEIDEVIASLLGQLASRAISGAAGLLGLSGGTGRTYSGYTEGSFLNNLVTESDEQVSTGELLTEMRDIVSFLTNYRELANTYQPRLRAYSVDATQTFTDRSLAAVEATNATAISNRSTTDINTLNDMISRYESGNQSVQIQIAGQFAQMSFYSQQDYYNSQTTWDGILNNAASGSDSAVTPFAVNLENMRAALAIQEDYNALAVEYRPDLLAYGNDPDSDPDRAAEARAAASNANTIISNTNTTIADLREYIAIVEDLNVTDSEKQAAVQNYWDMRDAGRLYTSGNIDTSRSDWEAILTPISYATVISRVSTALTLNQNYNTLADQAIIDLTDFINQALADPFFTTPESLDIAIAERDNANAVVAKTTADIATLDSMLTTLTDPAVGDYQKTIVQNNFYSITGLYTNTDLNNSRTDWEAALVPDPVPVPVP